MFHVWDMEHANSVTQRHGGRAGSRIASLSHLTCPLSLARLHRCQAPHTALRPGHRRGGAGVRAAARGGAHAQDGRARLQRGDAQRDLAVEAAGAPQRRVQRVRAVGRACPSPGMLSTAAGMPVTEGCTSRSR